MRRRSHYTSLVYSCLCLVIFYHLKKLSIRAWSHPPMSSSKQTKTRKGRSSDAAAYPKTIYLIRHGHSQGQAAKQNGLDRKRDPQLVDCGLTNKGIHQAHEIPSILQRLNGRQQLPKIDLVISSPLTRAMETAVLAFQKFTPQPPPFLIHYGLRELGSSIPENHARGNIEHTLAYIQEKHGLVEGLRIDSETLKPPGWPAEDGHDQHLSRTERIPQIFQWIATHRSEQSIAVVCHYNVIRSALQNGGPKPKNALPIPCLLYPDGRIEPYR
ncbi:PGAM [Seminavis robusta]|uniref:PGAM n=1 Tax=Seminavis robusta TaxID=568900 RepID=A0A9N8F078_9STRA|nr:PGAM [Seminavis robusta]|eukprot:Sro2763_g336520.1 PGAM (270) ;mRNA; f:3769-4578